MRAFARYPALLLALFAVVLVASGLHPRYRADWLLENLLVLVAAPVFILGYRRHPFSNAAYTRLFLFLVLHEIGAHYTYSEVPYDDWSKALAGFSINATFGWDRNHYDRLVHFLYGFLLFRVAWELHARLLVRSTMWTCVLSFCFVLSFSAIYELIEAGAAFLFAGDLGMAYLGTQGDVWDAQKDMAAACTGTLLAVALQLLRRLPRERGGEEDESITPPPAARPAATTSMPSRA